MTSDAVRMTFRLAYLTAILAGGGWIYVRAYAFEGMLVVAKDRVERTVAAPASKGGLSRAMQPGLPAELLHADNPRALARALDEDALYTASRLPFSVKLSGTEVLEMRPPRKVIESRVGRETTELPAEAGAKIAWDGGEATLREVRPWLGLLRTPSGLPMAAISLRKGDEAWTRGVFLREGAWRSVAPDTGLLLRWWRTEEEAKGRIPQSLGPFFGARWGAVDGGNVHWFASLAPGTGATLSDDTEVTLLAVEEDHGGAPGILVSLKPKGGEERREWHAAGETGPIRLEMPGRFARHVLINAWRDGAAYFAVFQGGQRGAVHRLDDGGTLDAKDGPGFSIRLDGVLRMATPSSAAQDQEVIEAALDTPAGEVSLREGAMHALKSGTQIKFRRVQQPPRVRYTLRLSGGEAGPAEVQLALGESVRRGHWTLRYARETATPEQLAVFEARRSIVTPSFLFGAFAIGSGCYGFVLARALMRRKDYSSSSAESAGAAWLDPPSEEAESDRADS